MTKAIITDQIQAQMEQAVDCLNADQPLAAQRHYEECARLCQALDLDKKILQEAPKPSTQLTIDV